MNETSAASLVRDLIATNPIFEEALALDIVNYSSLSRILTRHVAEAYHKRVSTESVKAAIIRYSEQIRKQRKNIERPAKLVIAKGQIQLKEDVAKLVVHISSDVLRKIGSFMEQLLPTETFHIIRGMSGILVLIDTVRLQDLLHLIPESQIVSYETDLCAIMVRSPREIETTPGVVYFFFRRLFLSGINVVEELSCYTDTIIVVSKPQAMKAYEALREMIAVFRTETQDEEKKGRAGNPAHP
jgi:hypothetical protein